MYAITTLIIELENSHNGYLLNEFTKVRCDFEYLLIKYDYLIQQIIRKYRGVAAAYVHIKDYYLLIIKELSKNTLREEVINKIISESKFNYLTMLTTTKQKTNSENFSRETKSAIFIKEALQNAPKCKICGGYLHTNSISIDHIRRKADGGLGNIKNGQLAHPYCNTTFKN